MVIFSEEDTILAELHIMSADQSIRPGRTCLVRKTTNDMESATASVVRQFCSSERASKPIESDRQSLLVKVWIGFQEPRVRSKELKSKT
eukprot:6163953-Amphidinium_carterae.1